jgi:carbon-monoxide dehydrogenase large subunit
MDPVEIRRRNLIADDAYPCASPSGLRFELLSHHAAMNKLMTMMDYDALRAEQATLRSKGIYRGIGIASFIESPIPARRSMALAAPKYPRRTALRFGWTPRVR